MKRDIQCIIVMCFIFTVGILYNDLIPLIASVSTTISY